MWSLVTSRGQRVPLRSLPAVLGSDAEAADVVLPHPSIAPRHARLSEEQPGRLHVEALDDAAVEAGGWKVDAADLAHGDELVLGRVVLTLTDDAAKAGAPASEATPSVPADDDGELVMRERGDGGSSKASAAAGGGGAGTRPTSRPAAGGARAGGAARAGGTATAKTAGNARAGRERGVLVVDHGTARRGLLHADLSQLGGPGKALVLLGVLAAGALLLWGVQAAVAALG